MSIRKFRHSIAKFRTSSHHLEVETGRYHNIDINLRTCKLCNDNVIEDEVHFLLCCPAYSDLRTQYIPAKYFINPNAHKFCILMSTKNDKLVQAVACYLYYAFTLRNELLI